LRSSTAHPAVRPCLRAPTTWWPLLRRAAPDRRPLPRASRLAAGLLLLLAGCVTVGPEYERPQLDIPEQWHEAPAPAAAGATDPAALARWWTLLDDPTLSRLIAQAADAGLDIREAQARVREARARRALAGADRFPTVDATASASRSRATEELRPEIARELYSAGFDARWELDVF